MKALIIDTSLEISYILLVNDSEIIFFKKFENQKLSKELFTSLENILDTTKTDISSLDYIATSKGPGSFTSLRVGAMIAKTFSYVKKIPLISYISMHAYRPYFDTKFLLAFDAKSEGLFLIEALEKNSKITYLSEPKLISIENAKPLIENYPIIITPHLDTLKEKVSKIHVSRIHISTIQNKFQKQSFDPHLLIDTTSALFLNKKFENLNTFNLLYLRGPKHT